MSIARNRRVAKRQLGQFLTPPALARKIIDGIEFCPNDKILEPSMGDGSFVIPLIEKMMALHSGDKARRLKKALRDNVFGVEIDPRLYARCLEKIKAKWGFLPQEHNLFCGDFLLRKFLDKKGGNVLFNHVVGNPPFGGTINEGEQDSLDRLYGFRNGIKIKKETYSFFIVKSMDSLQPDGCLRFICSDTFMTIKTMKGLRDFLFCHSGVSVENINFFSDEVSQKTVLLCCDKKSRALVTVDGESLIADDIFATPNHSWRARGEWTKFFNGPKIGDMMIATSGMTVGKNALFVREIQNGAIIEPYSFSYYSRPVTLADETQKARLGKLSLASIRRIRKMEASGETVRDVRIEPLAKPLKIRLPHPDYCPYNKATNGVIYTPPRHVIFWRDNGEAVYTFKKNGNWYLRGVGGKKHFFREGLTWNLISQRLRMRYLPAGHVLDSGAPCAFLRDGVDRDELFFILAWSLSDLCNDILKNVINHTKNIQSKDVERLPYPFWTPEKDKRTAIRIMRETLDAMQKGGAPEEKSIRLLNGIFSGYKETAQTPAARRAALQFSLFG